MCVCVCVCMCVCVCVCVCAREDTQRGSKQGVVRVLQPTSWDKLGYNRPVVSLLVILALPCSWDVTISFPVQAVWLTLKTLGVLTRGCHSSHVSSEEALRQMDHLLLLLILLLLRLFLLHRLLNTGDEQMGWSEKGASPVRPLDCSATSTSRAVLNNATG